MEENIPAVAVAGADLISLLPNDILISILSLVPLSTAARTTAVSKRWRPLFHSIPDLPIRRQNLWYSTTTVINILRSPSRVLPVSSFIINPHIQNQDMAAEFDQIAPALSFARLSDLTLNCYPGGVYTVSPLFLSITTLRRFDVRFCSLAVPPEFAGLPHLRILVLKVVALADDGHVERLVSRCRRLEELRLHYCTGLHRLAINSNSLKVLDVVHFGEIHISVEKAPLLAHARIDFQDADDGDDVMELEEGAAANSVVEVGRLVNLLRGLRQMESLHLGLQSEIVQRLKGNGRGFPEDLPQQLLNLKKIYLQMPLSDGYMLCILSCLLSSSPNVEDLVIHEYRIEDDTAKVEYQDISTLMNCTANWPACTTLYITIDPPERWLDFIKWLLENRNAIKNMIVSYHWLPEKTPEAKLELENALRDLKQAHRAVDMEVKTINTKFW